MKNSLILQQHLAYSVMIENALDFCSAMLTRSSTMYPFAATAQDSNIDCIFVPSPDQKATPHMIEDLQAQLDSHHKAAKNAVNLLVYSATVTQPEGTESDVLVFTLNDTQGHNTVTIYPYQHVPSGIKISQPYTCNFSD